MGPSFVACPRYQRANCQRNSFSLYDLKIKQARVAGAIYEFIGCMFLAPELDLLGCRLIAIALRQILRALNLALPGTPALSHL